MWQEKEALQLTFSVRGDRFAVILTEGRGAAPGASKIYIQRR